MVSGVPCVICCCRFGMFKLGGPWSKGPREGPIGNGPLSLPLLVPDRWDHFTKDYMFCSLFWQQPPYISRWLYCSGGDNLELAQILSQVLYSAWYDAVLLCNKHLMQGRRCQQSLLHHLCGPFKPAALVKLCLSLRLPGVCPGEIKNLGRWGWGGERSNGSAKTGSKNVLRMSSF